MNLMVWNEHFLTGIDSIDIQHKKLVDMINAAAPLLTQTGEVAARKVQPLLEQLTEYAETHFSLEEALMSERGIDPRYGSYHHGIHAAFTSEVALMRKEAMADGNVSGNDLLRFLISWLSFHILAEDKQVARQLNAISAGEPAAQAYDAISRGDSPAMTVLTDAMIDMFSLLTTRNLELASINRELNATKADLFAANQHLEARVAERTRGAAGGRRPNRTGAGAAPAVGKNVCGRPVGGRCGARDQQSDRLRQIQSRCAERLCRSDVCADRGLRKRPARNCPPIIPVARPWRPRARRRKSIFCGRTFRICCAIQATG